MKTMRNALFFLILSASISAVKAGDCLTFKTSDGQTQSLEIGDGLELSVEGTSLTVGNVSFELANLSKMFFTESISVSETGWATYSSSRNLDYTSASGLTVYSAQFNDNAGTVSLAELSEAVPGGEGVIVSATSGVYYVPVAPAANVLSGNGLLGTCSSEVTAEGTNYYALASVDNNVGFCRVNSGVTILANKAYYIAKSGSQARYMITPETTAIEKLHTSVTDGDVYDLNGRKITKDKMQHGVYVVKTKNGTHKIAVK